MTPAISDILIDIAAILLIFLIILRALPLLKIRNQSMVVVRFLFSMVSLMLSITYWLVYNFMRPETRMPFAANEVGEIAFYLLLASVLGTVFRESRVSAKKEIAATLIFAISSVALWIGWSGEWVEDIIFGIAFGYFLCTCVRSLKQTTVLNRVSWLVLGFFCIAIILAQTGTFLAAENIKKPLDLFSYGLMFTGLIWLFAKGVIAAKNNKDTKGVLALSFTVCGFALSTLYMSSGWFYLADFSICLATLPLMMYTLKREVTV